MSNICEYTLSELIDKIKLKKLSCKEIMDAYLNNIKKHNKTINAIANIDYEFCINEANKKDKELSENKYLGILHGIPIGIKDNYETVDYITTACSDVLKNTKKPKYDAPLIKLLKNSGAIIMAKTNMHEFAYGATNEISNIGPTHNPWNVAYITGGSSGGSGAGIASRMFPCALGSDTGGSIRIPSSGCLVSGIKPTYNLLDKSGIYPLSFSLDVGGPMAKNAKDLEILLQLLIDKPYQKSINMYSNLNSLKNLTFAIPVGINFERNEDVKIAFENAVTIIKNLGAKIEYINIPFMKEGLGAWKAILYSEASTYHESNLQNNSDKFNKNIKIMLESGKLISATDYIKAHQFRDVFIEQFKSIFEKYDGLLLSTLPVTVPRIGANETQINNSKISSQNSMTYIAWLANFLGTPEVSIPCGFNDNNLPIGLSIMGQHFNDFKILQIAKCFQKETSFHQKTPKFLS